MASDSPDLIWLRPEPSERRPRLRRDQITATALRLADTEGFTSVTMKRIAAELGVGTMSLYYYVRTKADVVALMHDAILADVLILDHELPLDWREAVTTIARRTRDVLLTHPWSIVSLDDAGFGPNAMRHMEQSLAALDPLNLDLPAKLSLWGIVDHFVLGSAAHTAEARTRTRLARQEPRMLDEAIAFSRELFATGAFPHLEELQRRQDAGRPDDERQTSTAFSGDQMDAQFERGLSALLDGLG